MRIAAFGGGTGMSCLLRGLREYSSAITAIVTVTDDGGSSGRLRKDFDMAPPGDIRSCLLALADGEPLLARLLAYRFEEAELAGHSFGNLFITALARVTGSFDGAVRELNRLLQVRGQVLPATGVKVSLIAQHPGGGKTTGEVRISSSQLPIERVEIRPRVGPAAPDVLAAIDSAELMCFGPGSLFTSVIPNLLVPGISERVAANPCPRIYIANIMTQPGETTGLDVPAHVRALEAHAGHEFISGVVLHEGPIDRELLQRYAANSATPVARGALPWPGRPLDVVTGDLVDRTSQTIRHDPDKLASLIAERYLTGPAPRKATS